jgi:hypothetical protein
MQPPQPSRVAAITDGLLSALGTIPDVTILDGPTPTVPREDVIMIGAGGDASFLVTQKPMPGLGNAYTELVHVICSLWSWSGSQGNKARRDRAAAMLELVAAALRADRKLGGACDICYLGPELEWLQQSDTSGAACSIGFAVTAKTNI